MMDTYTLAFFTLCVLGSLGQVGFGLTTGPGLFTIMVSTDSGTGGLPPLVRTGGFSSTGAIPFFCNEAKRTF